MIVKCEKCQVAFNINDSLIRPEGSKLRCSKCKHIFTVYPPEPVVPQAERPPVSQVRPPVSQVRPPVAPAPPEERISSSELTGGEVTLTIVDFSQEVFDTISGTAERYVEMGTIGKGGMGEVLLARDTQLLRKVAIKVLKKESVTPAALSFFLREAQITAQLDHPNIVPLYTVKRPAEGEKNVSFIMKLVKGKTLLELMNKVRTTYTENPKAKLPQELTQRTFLEHFLKACDGITYAHRKGVVHRDIKPANIMVGDFGEVYVMDWGIAKMLRDDEQDMPEQDQQILTSGMSRSGGTEIIGTQPEGVLGTPSYMSPEQAHGRRDVDTASDIFSLGTVLFELITLRPPRIGDAKQKLKWAKGGYLNRMIHMLPDRKIDPELKAIVHRATESEPQNRYPSISKMAEDLRCYLRGDEVSELPDNLPRKVLRWMGKHRQLTLILILGILLISSTVTIWGLHREQVAMKAAQIRESKLSHLQAEVSAHAHFIDSHFLRLEDLAASLANNAMYLIQEGPSNNERFYWLEDFQIPEKTPPDLNYSHLYKRPVSIEYPVVKPAPGVRREDVATIMQKLAPLRHHFKKTLLESRPGFAPVTQEEAHRLLTVHGIPIRWAYIGLEIGVMYSYPGKGSYGPEYDPRVRPWYKLGSYKHGVQWGNPYADIQGLGLVLPCAISLYDKENQFYGVLGMDVTFSDIIEDNLKREGSVGVIESFLLDDRGRIVVSSQLEADVQEHSTDPALKLEPFPVPEVAEAIVRGESGLREVEHNGESRIIVFYQMSALKWYYVEEIDTYAILDSAN
ncbi:protein kinase domain-containing protein [Desulfonema magnum]|uniref:Protein kinase, Zinc finger domain-containing and double Cache domain-containing n=1 Tax=Desulfonema magnum TaxID=45655 RepID=A0A975BM40_9BACT|nr:protein kinase [Desulfonema magnum]QTA87752.1 Protein kinase, Zinc finger domain-containing and double Cache domain-containing [Desulfonema magnum]